MTRDQMARLAVNEPEKVLSELKRRARLAGPDPRWEKGPRKRLCDMRNGSTFLSYEGETWTIVRKDRNVIHVRSTEGNETLFAARAEGVPQ